MRKIKRHTEAEIAAKLVEANALVAEGQTQDTIARTLGISVMTFHRWRKAYPHVLRSKAAGAFEIAAHLQGAQPSDPQRENQYTALKLENMRLRKLVTDLLLEKMSLEDEMQPNSGRVAAEDS